MKNLKKFEISKSKQKHVMGGMPYELEIGEECKAGYKFINGWCTPLYHYIPRND